MCKKALCLIFAFLFSIESFAAVVSDNDGAAFVTKAEFEALKENFANQVTNYNASIDSKIDGAIASYLAGTRMAKTETVKLDPTFTWVFPIVCMNNSEWNNKNSKYYSYEMPEYLFVALIFRAGRDSSRPIATVLDFDAISAISTDKKSDYKAVCLQKNWYETPTIYNEMISISDDYINRTMGTTNLKCYKLNYVGKGRHSAWKMSMGGGRDAGHIYNQTTPRYFTYTGIAGIQIRNADGSVSNGTINTMKKSTFSNWTTGTWSRTGGASGFSSVGWGTGNTAYALPANNLDLDGARTWAATYSSGETTAHDAGSIEGISNGGNLKTSIKWKDDNNCHRSWIFTGNSDAPATSPYGWYFDFQKPNNANEKFEGYIMRYENDLGMAVIQDDTWAGFHSWAPVWYWRYIAGGTIGTKPSESQFSKLPAKQIYYTDNENKTHYLDEGLFLINMPGAPDSVEFSAKWSVLDPTITTEQKINLRISSTPFSADHDNTKNLKYQVDGGAESESQQVTCGTTKKIKVMCDENVKQLYMMWTPVTSGTYLGLSELSDFAVVVEQ